MDITGIAKAIAKLGLPLLGAALPIPGGAAIGAALASCIGASSSDPQDILTKLTEDSAAVEKAHEFELTHQAAMLKLTLDAQSAQFQSEVDDREDARSKLASNAWLWRVAMTVMLTFAAVMTAVLYGSWMLLEGGITIKDVSVVAAISGLVGAVVGYVAANAQTVINFLFGGSMGNEKNAGALAASVQTATAALAQGANTPWLPADHPTVTGVKKAAGTAPAATDVNANYVG